MIIFFILMDPCLCVCLCWIGCSLVGVARDQQKILKLLEKPRTVRMKKVPTTEGESGSDVGKSEK